MRFNKNIQFLFLAFLVSLFTFWGANFLHKNVGDLYFFYSLSENPEVFLATTHQAVLDKKIFGLKETNSEIVYIDTAAQAAFSKFVHANGQGKVLFAKNANERLAIASVTKLMSAIVILEHFNMNVVVSISEKAAQKEGLGSGIFKTGERFVARALLYSVLMESNNTAVFAFAEKMGEKAFINFMNQKAETLGLKNTQFFNSTGLDPDDYRSLPNYSSARDLAAIVEYLVGRHPQAAAILALPEYGLRSAQGSFHHKIVNINEMLADPDVLWGKTGWTPMAGGCLITVQQAAAYGGYVVNVVLAVEEPTPAISRDQRFEEMRKIMSWVKKKYYW